MKIKINYSAYKSTNFISILNRYNKLKNKIKTNIKHDRVQKVATIFVDLKIYFDVVDHNILIDKLESYGFRVKMKAFLKIYL